LVVVVVVVVVVWVAFSFFNSVIAYGAKLVFFGTINNNHFAVGARRSWHILVMSVT